MHSEVFDQQLSSQEKLSDQEAKGGVSYYGPGDILSLWCSIFTGGV